MKTRHKLAVCILAFVGLLVPQFVAANDNDPVMGIATHNMSNYVRAKQALKEQYPEFLTAFNEFAQAVSTLQETDKAGQYQAMMDFFPAIEKILEDDPSISADVVASYFEIALEMANDSATNVNDLLFEAFRVYLDNGDVAGILSEEDLMEKYGLNTQEAQRIREVLHLLYPTSTLL